VQAGFYILPVEEKSKAIIPNDNSKNNIAIMAGRKAMLVITLL